jgi:hypothetical protein
VDIEQSKAVFKKSNPVRADLPWTVILIEGLVLGGIGIYAVVAEESAQRNIVFLIAAFLVLNGLSAILAAIRDRRELSIMTPFNYFRSGIALATGTIVAANRFTTFMEINAARVCVGVGLIFIGAVAIVGLVVASKQTDFRPAAYVIPLVLTVLGIVVVYQAANDRNSSKLIGWVFIAIGVGLVAIGIYRRQQQLPPAEPTEPATAA